MISSLVRYVTPSVDSGWTRRHLQAARTALAAKVALQQLGLSIWPQKLLDAAGMRHSYS